MLRYGIASMRSTQWQAEAIVIPELILYELFFKRIIRCTIVQVRL